MQKVRADLWSRALAGLLVALSYSWYASAQTSPENGETKEGECLDEKECTEEADRRSVDSKLSLIEVYGVRNRSEPGSLSQVTNATIRDLAADHPAEILNLVPGVNIQMNSGQEHLISIRSPVLTGGAGQGSFLILENGVPTRAAAFGNVNALFELHHEVADAIEIVRGPVSAKYGSNGVHGLINVIYSPPENDIDISRVSASSLGRYRGDFLDSSKDTHIWLSVHQDLGWRDDSGVDQQKLSFVTRVPRNYFPLGYTADGNTELDAWVVVSNLNQETADFVQGVQAYKDREKSQENDDPLAGRDAFSVRSGARWHVDSETFRATVIPYAIWQKMSFRQHFLPNKSFEENGHSSIGTLTRFENDFSNVFAVRYGFDFAWANGYLKETQAEEFGFFPGDSRFPAGTHYDYDVKTLSLAGWVETQFDWTESLTVIAGLRAEGHQYSYSTNVEAGDYGRFRVPADSDDDFSLLTPKLGVIWTSLDSDLSVFLNIARGERAPQVSDLYRLQNRQEPSAAETEQLDSFELGVRGGTGDGGFSYQMAAYTAQKRNFFFRDSDGLNVTNGETEHSGFELSVDLALTTDFTFNGAVAWADHTYAFARDVNSASNTIEVGNKVKTAPEWQADVSLSWNFDDSNRIMLRGEHIGEYFLNEANSVIYPGHSVFHLSWHTEISNSIAIDVIFRNLFDEKYADRADFGFGAERYFPGEPVNLTLRLQNSF